MILILNFNCVWLQFPESARTWTPVIFMNFNEPLHFSYFFIKTFINIFECLYHQIKYENKVIIINKLKIELFVCVFNVPKKKSFVWIPFYSLKKKWSFQWFFLNNSSTLFLRWHVILQNILIFKMYLFGLSQIFKLSVQIE